MGPVAVVVFVLVAALLKGLHLVVHGLVVFQQSKKELKVKYSVVQPGEEQTKGKTRVVISGGCGLLGRHIVQLLTERFSDKLSVSVLDWQAQPEPRHPNVEYIVGDVRVASHAKCAVAGAAAVIHTAALQQTATTDMDLMHGVIVQGTRYMLEACLDKDVKVMLLASSVLVHFAKGSGSLGQVSEEQSPPPETTLLSRYAAGQREAERMVLAANSHVVRTAVLRSGILLGAGTQGVVDQVFDHSIRRAAAAAAAAAGPQAAARMLPYCWVCDAARAHVMALLKLLLPNDEEAMQLAAQPWKAASPALEQDSEEYVHVARPQTSPPAGKVAGQVFHLAFDPDMESRAAVGLDGLVGVPHECEGWSTLPLGLGLLLLLARFNEAVGRRLGVAPCGKKLTAASVQLAQHPGGLFSVKRAQTVLGWHPAPWKHVRQLLRTSLTRHDAGGKLPAAVSGDDKKTQ